MRLFILILTIVLCSSRSHCAVVEYGLDDRDQWFADVGGAENVSTVDFTGYADFTPITNQWAYLGIHFSGFVVTSGFGEITFPNDGWGVRGEPDINVTFDEPINWIAADFPGYTNLELYKDDVLLHTSSTWGLGGAGRFGGLISGESFDQVRFFGAAHAEFLDDLHFGPVIAVPAPGSIVAFGLPLVLKRRRRRPIRFFV